jgi:hypothetical protein
MSVLLLLLAVEVALGVVAALGGFEDEEPHAASPTTAAAARTDVANHRLPIVSTPFVTVTRSPFSQEHVPPREIVQKFQADLQAAMRWASQASESGYR